ncbi:MAG: hypothetical protein KJ950_11285 [Proteobacteria bacterium]|nr:hypothetical protein [Pseudomonadota bacterium]MBU1688311.1 hypothetical protein [Pseudomonadota bacterium]
MSGWFFQANILPDRGSRSLLWSGTLEEMNPKEQALQSGIQRFLTKPLSGSELTAVICELLNP